MTDRKAGMTDRKAGMTDRKAGMTDRKAGMTDRKGLGRRKRRMTSTKSKIRNYFRRKGGI